MRGTIAKVEHENKWKEKVKGWTLNKWKYSIELITKINE